MEWKWRKRKTGLGWVGSGPQELRLLKKMASETGNYFLSLLNGKWKEEKGR